MNVIEAMLDTRFESLGLDALGVRRPIHTVLLTPRFAESRHVIALVPEGASRRLALVVKAPRDRADVSGIAAEAECLKSLHQLVPSVASSAPCVITEQVWAGIPLLVETAVQGRIVLHRELGRRGGALFSAYKTWLRGLPVTGRTATDRAWFDRLVTRPIHRLENALSPDDPEHELVTGTRRALEPLQAVDLPLVFEHGDASVPNLLWRGGRDPVGMIDWELAEPRGLPGHDLGFLLATVASARARATSPETQAAVFAQTMLDPDGWARQEMMRYLDDVRVDSSILDLLLLASRARYAVRTLHRLAGAGSPEATGHALAVFRSSPHTRLWWTTFARHSSSVTAAAPASPYRRDSPRVKS
jgi:aminoglycoside phosphotransferase (APT) family kinase protein